jgi:hypothetical protein
MTAEIVIMNKSAIALAADNDGLIWIKRKHYFQPELNHHFFSSTVSTSLNII